MKKSMDKKIITLEATNSLGGRYWNISLTREGYRLECGTYGSWGDSEYSGFIPTAEAVGYIRLAMEGKFQTSLHCWGVEEADFVRLPNGEFSGYTYCD